MQHARLRRYDQRVEINDHGSIGLFLLVVVLDSKLELLLLCELMQQQFTMRIFEKRPYNHTYSMAHCQLCMVADVVTLRSNAGLSSLTHLMCRVADGITRGSTLDGGWSDFGACSVACDGGTQIRTCSEPSPANGGKDCEGEATQTCNTQACAGTVYWG